MREHEVRQDAEAQVVKAKDQLHQGRQEQKLSKSIL